jgi:MFS family permease
MLFAGVMAGSYNRRFLLGIASICWAFSSVGTAFVHKYVSLAFCRMLLGVFESFSAPTAYSLITDYFPPESRSLANSFFTGALYLGASLSSLCTIMIQQRGWRETYLIVGLFGICVGILFIMVVRE